MKIFWLIYVLSFQHFFFMKNYPNGYCVKTPDNNNFSISIVGKKQADSLEAQYKKNKIDDQFLSTYKRSACLIDNGRVLYRQFFEDIGFVFPSISDFNKVLRGKTYWQVSLQPTDDDNNLTIINSNYTRMAVSFAIYPALANSYRKDIEKEISGYLPFEGYNFYKLQDGAVVMLRKRTLDLSEGYWFSSFEDFDFFYYVLSGKDRPKSSV